MNQISVAKELRAAFVVLGAMTVVTGLAYPLTVTAIAQIAFPHQANGSIISKNGKPVGSELIGQQFDDPKYLWGRLSGTSPAYNASASSGTNYGPLHPALRDAASARLAALRVGDPDNRAPVPVDLVTASGSGLDPQISPAAAEYQVMRVARTRGLAPARVRTAIAEHTVGRGLGVLGEPAVNVLGVNLALDALR